MWGDPDQNRATRLSRQPGGHVSPFCATVLSHERLIKTLNSLAVHDGMLRSSEGANHFARCFAVHPYLFLHGRDKLPHVGAWVVALHAVQLSPVVAPADCVNMAARHADAVVGVLLPQRLDGAPAVVTRVISERSRVSEEGVHLHE